MSSTVTNVVVAGLGGQGVLKASDILAEAAFRSGLDVKKSEIHGMSQRGGSVSSDVRFSASRAGVLSPMVPDGEADFLVVLAADQVEVNDRRLRKSGVLISPGCVVDNALPSPRSLNVALLGVLSTYLEIELPHWKAAIEANLPPKVHEANLRAFAMGQATRETA